MQRMGFVIGLKAEKVAEYRALHAAVWPEVLKTITDCNISNYSIFLKEPENLLFAYLEYHGTDYAKDMKKMAADPKNPGMVGDLWPLPSTIRHATARRMVGRARTRVPNRIAIACDSLVEIN